MRAEESKLRNIFTQRTFQSDGKSVTDMEHLTEKLMNNLLNLYGIAVEQNED